MSKVVETKYGPVKALHNDGLIIARGVPFAHADRFKRPVQPTPWTETRDCTERGPVCPQQRFRFEFVLGPVPVREISEDCLRVSITAPDNAKDLPVVVWYHGGANIGGAADLDVMDLSELARLGLVCVAVQYRLGVFGCLNFDDVQNLHVYDQLEALKWAKDNAQAFGGDPNNITIMGQSAGGIACYNMLRTTNLFKKAVIISAPISIMTGQSDERKVIKKSAGNMDGTTEEVNEIQGRVIEEAVLRGRVVEGFSADHKREPFTDFHEAELLIGWTADDCLPFLRLHPAGIKVAGLPGLGYAASWLATEFVFKRPGRALDAQWKKRGWKSTTYSFDWFPAGSPLRACHCMEMPFMFGGWASWAAAPLMEGAKEEEVSRLGIEFKKMLYTFITKGLPAKHISVNKDFTVEGIGR